MRKYYIWMLIFLCLFIVSVNSVNAKRTAKLKNKAVIIDPGHGGVDPGTIYQDIYEKNISLSVSLFLKDYLEKFGIKVLMTRDGDYDLSSPEAVYRKKSDFDQRISLINNSSADLYLSIHLNYLNDANYYGPQVFFLNGNQELAHLMQKELNDFTKTKRSIKLIPNDIYMYKKLRIPGLLIECGFLSNDYERNLLIETNYQQELAKIIANAVVKNYRKI